MSYKDSEKQKAFQREWLREKRLLKKKEAFEILGGKCKRCGYKENIVALQIDHVIPVLRGRDFVRSSNNGSQQLISRIAKGVEDISNLQLLCANCHAIKTFEEDRKQFKNYIH